MAYTTAWRPGRREEELVDIVVAEAKTGGNRRQRQEVEHFTDGGPTINQPKDPKKRLSDRVIGAG